MDDQESAPDIYADGFQVTVTPFGVNMSFSLREAHPNPNQSPTVRESSYRAYESSTHENCGDDASQADQKV